VWFLGVVAAAYTLYFAGLVSAIVSTVLIFVYRREELGRLWRSMPWVVLGWTVLYVPWLPIVFSLGRRSSPVDRETLDPSWLRYRLQALGTGDWQVEAISAGSYAFWLLVSLGLLLAWRSRPAIVAAVWLVVCGLLVVLVLQVRPHFPAVRYLLPSWLGAFLLAAHSVAMLQRARIAWLGWAAVGLVLLFDVRTLVAYYDHGRPEWNKVAAYLQKSVAPGARVVAANSWVQRNLGYYWDQRARPDISFERAGLEITGPTWIVFAVCPVDPAVQHQLRRLPLVASFPTTNHCTIRYLPAGERLALPHGLCLRDV
jgi:hypothetical protein